jgi:SAM-dependent methyltransferase
VLAFAGMSNPLASPLPWDLVADEYAEFTAPFFANYARVALDRAGVGAGSRVLDVACGPGTLSLLAAKRGSHVTAVDFAPATMQRLEKCAKREAVAIRPCVADGQALPLSDASYEAAFSMFGLIFFPDRAKGLRELLRVLVPGGVAAIASWQPMERFPLLADAYATIRHLLPNLPFGAGKAPLGEAHEVLDEMRSAGFADVIVEEVQASATPTRSQRPGASCAEAAHPLRSCAETSATRLGERSRAESWQPWPRNAARARNT